MLQATSDANSVTIAIVIKTMTASASNFGSHLCRRFWSGHTIAMISKANVNGANTTLRKYRAATTIAAVQIPTATPSPRMVRTFSSIWGNSQDPCEASLRV